MFNVFDWLFGLMGCYVIHVGCCLLVCALPLCLLDCLVGLIVGAWDWCC